jgi:hypothetical protein
VEIKKNKAKGLAAGAAKLSTAAVLGLSALLASPEHILIRKAPIPLAFTG